MAATAVGRHHYHPILPLNNAAEVLDANEKLKAAFFDAGFLESRNGQSCTI